MTFTSRQDAGQRLGQYLRDKGVKADVVVGLPRGGVVVAAEAARVLGLPLDVLVVRKIGHPRNREFAVGALAEAGVVMVDEDVVALSHVVRADLDEVIAEETERFRQYEAKFHGGGKPDFAGKSVVLADDGLATGSTMEAAVLSARKQGARWIIVAVPVASTSACVRLKRVADEVIALVVDEDFDAVGRYYQIFYQTTDEEVLDLLKGNG